MLLTSKIHEGTGVKKTATGLIALLIPAKFTGLSQLSSSEFLINCLLALTYASLKFKQSQLDFYAI